MSEDDFKDDEIIEVKMPRKDFQTMQKIVHERQAYDIITGKLKTWWVWVVVAGALSVYALWDTIRIKVGS